MRSVVMVLFFSIVTSNAIAEDRFYTTVDAQGRVQVIKSSSVETDNKKTQQSKADVKPSTDQQTISEQESKEPVVSTSASQGIRKIDEETYIDTELLEKKNFNLEDKKRFYFLPDGGIGSRVVESHDGIVSRAKVVAETLKPKTALVSPEYQVLLKDDIRNGYALENNCLDPLLMKKKTKPFKDINNIWVQPAFIVNAIEIDGLLKFPNLRPNLTQLRLVSFANTHKKSTFYLPVVVFLDDKGCVLSGAWHYWSRAQAGTETQYASVDGLVTIPSDSTYILFYRPLNSLKADIPLNRESGSFVVEAY